MKIYDIFMWLVVLILGVLELKRAWTILIKKEIGYFTGTQVIAFFALSFGFKKFEKKYIESQKQPRIQRYSGYLGLIIGTLIVLGSLLSLPDIIAGTYKY